MALLIFNANPAQIDSVVLDVVKEETLTHENDVTDHPVEQGADISDHIRPKPKKIALEALVSNTPLTAGQRTRVVNYVTANTGQLFSFTTTSINDALAGHRGYAEAAYEALQKLADDGAIFRYVGKTRTYENVVFENFTVTRNKDTGDALRFSATLKQIRFVTNKSSIVKVAKEPKANKPADKGKQTAEDVTSDRKTSILRDLGNALGISK